MLSDLSGSFLSIITTLPSLPPQLPNTEPGVHLFIHISIANTDQQKQ